MTVVWKPFFLFLPKGEEIKVKLLSTSTDHCFNSISVKYLFFLEPIEFEMGPLKGLLFCHLSNYLQILPVKATKH